MSKLRGKRLGVGRPTREAARSLSERILAVAERQFLANGYAETTFERIAAEAHTTKATLYTHFKEKGNLFSKVCRRLIEEHYRSDIVRLDDTLPMRDSLREQALALLSAAMDPRALALYDLIQKSSGVHAELTTSTIAVWEFYVCQLETYFKSRIERQLLQLRNPRATATIFARMIFGPIHIALVHGMPLPTKEDLRQHVDDVVLVFLSGIGRLELEAEIPSFKDDASSNPAKRRGQSSRFA